MKPCPLRLLFIALSGLCLIGCQSTADVTLPSPHRTVADEATVEDRRVNLGLDESAFADLMELEDLCWYMRFEKNIFTSEAPVTLVCRRLTDGVSHTSINVEGKTLSEVIRRALPRVKQNAGHRGVGTFNRLTLPAAVATMEKLNEKCWNLVLEKNSGWLFVGKARLTDELVSRTSRADGDDINLVLKNALQQLN